MTLAPRTADRSESALDTPGRSSQATLHRLAVDTGWMGLVVVLPLVVRLGVTPIRVRMLVPADFGTVSVWAAAIGIVGGFALWPTTGLMRYLPAGDPLNRAQVIRGWLTATALTAAVVGTAFAGWSLRGGSAWTWVAVIVVLEVVIAAAIGYARAADRFNVVTMISITGNVGGLLLGTALIAPLGPTGVLAGWLLADVVAVVFCLITLGPSIVGALAAGPGSQLGRLVRFSAPLAVSNGTWMLVTWLDRPLLVGIVSTAEIGIYSLAYSVVAAPLAGLFMILSSVTWNHAVRVFETDGYGAAEELLNRSSRIYTALAVPTAVWLGVFGPQILGILAPESYEGGAQHMAWLAVGVWFYGLLPYRNQHLLLWKRSGAAAASPLAALVVNVLVLQLAAPRYGAVGASVATAAAYGMALLLATGLSRRDERVHSRLPIKLIAVCSTATFGVALLVRPTVDRITDRPAQALALAAAAGLLVALSLIIEGTARRLLVRRWTERGAACAI